MVLMFGYANFADPNYLKALLGVVPQHFPAILEGFQVQLQQCGTMPPLVRKIANSNWGPGKFKAYYAYRTGSPLDKIEGIAWEINGAQKGILDDWQFAGIWFKESPVIIKDRKGGKHPAYVYHIPRRSLLGKIKIHFYNAYPVDKKKTLMLARQNNLLARRARGEQ
jgi:hypothetical protein